MCIGPCHLSQHLHWGTVLALSACQLMPTIHSKPSKLPGLCVFTQQLARAQAVILRAASFRV